MSTIGQRVAALAGELERSDQRLLTALLATGLAATLYGLLRRAAGHGESPPAETALVALLAAMMGLGLIAVLSRPERVQAVRRIVSAGVVAYMLTRFASLLFFHAADFGPPSGFVLWLSVTHFLVFMNLPKRRALPGTLAIVGVQAGLSGLAAARGVAISPAMWSWLVQLFLAQLAVVFLLHFFTLRQEQLVRTRTWAERLEALALQDHLTGLANRRALEEALDRQLARAERAGTEVAAVLLDLDRFKAVNDSLGHEAGDRVLEGVGARIEAALRRGDLAGRFGGEEFLVIAADTDRGGGLALAERLLERVRAPGLLPERSVTASAGVAVHRAGESAETLLKRADEALYRAKAAGRDRAVAAPGP